MTLRDYASKRRLGLTPEPGVEGGRARRRAGGRPIFVVQLHHARARHYDFRLEADGVLKSWAVPKGPSLRAGEKRLAVEVEDHPIDYAGFEGDIPKGHYGAGHVDLFDRGTWSTERDALEQIAAGKLDFELDGERLHGGYTLVRTRRAGRQPQWLLIKRGDEHARDLDADGLLRSPVKSSAKSPASPASSTPSRALPVRRATPAGVASRERWRKAALAVDGATPATMPKQIELQLASLRERPPATGEWLYEIKWDGYRLLAWIRRGVRLESRNRIDWSARFPALVEALGALPVRSAVLDGELIALDAEGRSDFGELQRRLEAGEVGGLRYVVFDLLYLDGIDLREAGQADRRALLRRLLETSASPVLVFSEHVEGSAAQVLAASARAGLEGIVCKRVAAPYRGGRSQAWIKLKHVADEEFVVVGYTPPRNSRSDFGSLLLARPEGGGWRYFGRVGSGFDDVALRAIGARLRRLHRDRPVLTLPAHVPFPVRKVQWVRPQLVIDVQSRGRGKEGLLRQASFLRLREDKAAADLAAPSRRRARTPEPGEDTAMKQLPPDGAKKARGRSRSNAPKTDAESRRSVRVESLPLTHPERIVYPDAGIRKGEVAEYYRAVSAWLLPELIDRPLSLLRCPHGIADACFFQKHYNGSFGRDVHPVALEESGGRADYVYVRDLDGVLALVQMNTIEFHPWGARRKAPDKPDRMVFDLDPAEGIAWSELKRAAREVRDRLAELGLESWVRLSGGKGVHVVVPIRPGPQWSEVKDFCEAFADAMSTQSPLHYVATASKAARKGRIFIDWLRNTRGATSVAGWSLRARAGAPVAMPLRWDEFSRSGSSTDFDLPKAVRRAARLRSDPWEGFAESRQRLPGR
ncbi:DNA ligase D [Lysobacter firmicutimachus]|uniref:DNA ligase (ATP) n=1 Tax=Lysobacter firmicutimachus TaxID=1792846 RepID=A0ABU8D2K6_9GAMM